mgnify:CR=1
MVVSSSSVRAALSIRQKKGKFKNLQMTTRGKRGAVATYIMNVEKPSETVVRKAKPTVEG